MADFHIRSDNVDVEQIMKQIRARIREKRGVDYTEQEIRELADAKLERFLDPGGVRSDLVEQFRKSREAAPAPLNYTFEEETLFETHRPVLRWIRKMLMPVLKLFFNPTPIWHVLHLQSKINDQQTARQAWLEPLYYEVIHNLVLETTRLGIEVKNLKMRLESMSSRLDFDERRARALEGVVQYRPGAVAPLQPPTSGDAPAPGSQQERRTRRRRRRGRKPGVVPGGSAGAPGPRQQQSPETNPHGDPLGEASQPGEPSRESATAGSSSELVAPKPGSEPGGEAG